MNRINWFWLFLLLISCNQQLHIANIEQSNYLITGGLDSLPTNESLVQEIAIYKAKLEKEMNVIIGVVEEDMHKKKPESILTHWMADVLRRQTVKISGKQIDLSVLNYGGIRLPMIPKGPITTGKVYELMPFDNYIVILEVSGAVILEMFTAIAQIKGGFPVCENVKFIFKDGEVVELLIGGEKLEDDRIYNLATTSFIADGGDQMTMLLGNKRYDYPTIYRDAIITDIQEQAAKGVNVGARGYGRMMSGD